MVDTTTTDYDFVKPEIGGSEDTWGTKLNSNWQKLDDLLSLTTLPNLTSVVNRKNGDDRYLKASGGAASNPVISDRVTFNAGLVLANNQYLYGKDNSGTLRGLVALDNSNRNRFGNNNYVTLLDGTTIELQGSTKVSGGLTVTSSATINGSLSAGGGITADGLGRFLARISVETTSGATKGEINPLDGTGVRIGSTTNSDVLLRRGSTSRFRLASSFCGTDYRFYCAANSTSGSEPDFNLNAAEGVKLSYANDAGQVLVKGKASSSVNTNAVQVVRGTSLNMNVKMDGDINNISGAIGKISDATLKKNITDIDPQLAAVLQMRVVDYELIDYPEHGVMSGFVAQEMQKIRPKLVKQDEDTGTLYMSEVGLVPLLVKAIQELNAKVEAMDAKLAAVEARR